MSPTSLPNGAMSGRPPVVVKRPGAADGIGHALRTTFGDGGAASLPSEMMHLLRQLDTRSPR